jgi:hypothetical protein
MWAAQGADLSDADMTGPSQPRTTPTPYLYELDRSMMLHWLVGV